jgi:hypothetical protein
MTTTSPPAPTLDGGPRAGANAARRIAGTVRLLAGLAVLVALSVQITDLVTHDALVPDEYFSYFTIQTSMINIVVLLVGGVLALRWRRDTELFTAVRMSALAYGVVTGVVYNVLLRGGPSEGYVGLQWPGEVMHVWIPVYILLDYLLAPGRVPIGWGRLLLAIAYPLLWLGYTLVRGVVTGWYPYPFLEPDGPDGPVSVLIYIVALCAFIIVIAAAAIGISRIVTHTEGYEPTR